MKVTENDVIYCIFLCFKLKAKNDTANSQAKDCLPCQQYTEYLDVSEPIQIKTELVLLLLLHHVCAESNFTWEAFLNMGDI